MLRREIERKAPSHCGSGWMRDQPEMQQAERSQAGRTRAPRPKI